MFLNDKKVVDEVDDVVMVLIAVTVELMVISVLIEVSMCEFVVAKVLLIVVVA